MTIPENCFHEKIKDNFYPDLQLNRLFVLSLKQQENYLPVNRKRIIFI